MTTKTFDLLIERILNLNSIYDNNMLIRGKHKGKTYKYVYHMMSNYCKSIIKDKNINSDLYQFKLYIQTKKLYLDYIHNYVFKLKRDRNEFIRGKNT